MLHRIILKEKPRLEVLWYGLLVQMAAFRKSYSSIYKELVRQKTVS